MSDDSLEEQLDKLEEAAHSGDQQHPIIRFLPIIIPVAALPVLVVAALFFTSFSDDEPERPIPPIVLTPDDLIKMEPTEPGGVVIPDQDKMVYDPMKQGSGDGAGEKVLPLPEAPMAPPEGGADLAAAIPPPPGTMEPILPPPPGAEGAAGALTLPEIPTSDSGKTATAPPPAGKTNIVPPPPPAPPKVPETATATKTPDPVAGPKTTARVPPAPAGKGSQASGSTTSTKVVSTTQTASLGRNYRVQIQSLKSQSQAEKAWEGWVKKHPDLFGKLSLTVQRAVIKDRGTYYRVQAGPFADHKKADEVCRALKKRGQDCLVVRP